MNLKRLLIKTLKKVGIQILQEKLEEAVNDQSDRRKPNQERD